MPVQVHANICNVPQSEHWLDVQLVADGTFIIKGKGCRAWLLEMLEKTDVLHSIGMQKMESREEY